MLNLKKKGVMNGQVLKQEQETFKKKGWKPLVKITFILKILFSIISFIYLFSKIQDQIREFRNYNNENN